MFGPSSTLAQAPELPDASVDADVEGPSLEWDPAWGTFSTADWVVTGTAMVTTLTATIAGPLPSHRRGGILFDEAARDSLRLGTEVARRNVRDVSDVLLTLLASYPFAIDALVVAGWHHNSPEVAREMALLNLETLAVMTAIQSLTKVLVSRERPYGRECGGELNPQDRACTRGDRYASFFSGHSAVTFTAAGLICSHHMNLDLYGDSTASAAVCATGLVLAGTTAVLRVVGDQHYASDIIIGSAVGALVGFGVPWLLRYRHGSDRNDEQASRSDGPTIHIVPAGLGVGAVGTF